MKIFLATSNEHKAFEFSNMFAAERLDCQIFCAKDAEGFEPPEENGATFAENAFIKADALKKFAPADAFVMADDSGLVVDALGGAPGIMSARYAGVEKPGADAANNAKLLREMESVPDEKRTARFVCAIALLCPDGLRILSEGKIEGIIGRAARGSNGFGYDPLFYLPDRRLTTAELEPSDKDAISHRGTAFAKLAKFLRENRANLGGIS